MRKLKKDRRRVATLENDQLPAPLQRSAPRDVTLNGSGWVSAICAIALLLGGAVGGPFAAGKLAEDSERAAKLHAAGVSTEANVIQVRKRRGDNPQLTVEYRYSANGQEFSNRVQLRRDDPMADTVDTGARIQVRYLPSEPRRSWPAGYGPREQPVWPAAILPAIAIPGAVAIMWLLHRQKRLLREGRAAMARVTSANKTSKYEDSWRVSYSWTLLSGAVRKAHVSRTADPGSGAFVPVIYDPDHPEHHSVYPLSLVRLR